MNIAKIISALIIPFLLFVLVFTTVSKKDNNTSLPSLEAINSPNAPDYTLTMEYKLELTKSVKNNAPELMQKKNKKFVWVGHCSDVKAKVVGDKVKIGDQYYCFYWNSNNPIAAK